VRLATAREARRLDELSQTEYGLPGEILMESAGLASAREIEQSFLPELRSRRRIAIVCGAGNNGGDGLVVARHFASRGRRVYVAMIGCRSAADAKSRSGSLLTLQLERLLRAASSESIKIVYFPDKFNPEDLARDLRDSCLAVDAVFGIGLRFEDHIRSPYREAIRAMRSSAGTPIISLDLPSGLDADRGRATEADLVVKADMTLTFGLAKPGFFINEGPALTGRLRILPIGFPLEAQRQSAASTFAVTQRQASRALPRWSSGSNKSQHGHALLIAGSAGMWGAALLASSAAYRIGSGYVTLASHLEPTGVVMEMPEILTAKISDEKLWSRPRWNALAVGPGLGVLPETRSLLEKMLASPQVCERKVILDADALTVLSQLRKDKPGIRLPSHWLLTPHAGELARLLSEDEGAHAAGAVKAADIEADRLHYAREAAAKWGCHVLLKGFRTIVAKPDGRAWIVLAGNSALAKAGTGDVLCGIIVGLLAQGLEPLTAAAVGAFIHGAIADQWVKSGQSRRSLQASDLRDLLPAYLAQLRNAKTGGPVGDAGYGGLR
jgi:NAD(P)H-hydrate epimerase